PGRRSQSCPDPNQRPSLSRMSPFRGRTPCPRPSRDRRRVSRCHGPANQFLVPGVVHSRRTAAPGAKSVRNWVEDPRRTNMQVKDIMTRGVEVVYPDSNLQEAAEKMRTLNVGSLPVCEGERVVGMITDRDITVRAVAKGQDPLNDHVRDV